MSLMDREHGSSVGPYSGASVFADNQAPQGEQAYGAPATPYTPIPEAPSTGPISSSNGNYALMRPVSTGQLSTNVSTDGLALAKSKTTALRPPVTIAGENGKRTTSIRPPQGRRVVIQIGVATLMLFIMVGSLLMVNTLGGPLDAQAGMGNLTANGQNQNVYDSKAASDASIVEQAATQTAVTMYGNDDLTYNNTTNNSGGALAGGTSNHGAYGQCTYWASYRFHQLFGVWVPWYGNAWEWDSGARQYGYHVSASPSVGAIIVLQPGVQGAGGVGHVAIVESINSDGSVHTSNYNWYNNGGGFATLSYWDFYPGAGVSFITLP
ncbi:CHAP domain-containing protein [Ktedonospora formicarum]|uniref:Peptidase C51 domain-containing protein n=1 Tax=Ktedonospora formicarum TaxID=2778364 RepID=A0A8J3I3F6_9CHLR|nr:CHAP domain-containing protein [Ktedonospora formicarum]GHO49442.1 hypothetical protein KSX_76050 [Ktedonospora formicarum]